jgi:hypothetical protein
MPVGPQLVWNLTTMQLTQVDWPGHPPVAVLAGGEQIMEIVIWVHQLNRWMRIGTQGRSADGTTISLAFAEAQYLSQMIASGVSLAHAVSMLFPG